MLLLKPNDLMSTIDKSLIPDGVNTVERLAAYAFSILLRNNPTLKVLEAENDSKFAVEAQVFKAADGTNRVAYRGSLPLETDWNSDITLPFYQKVQELSNTALPADFIQQDSAQ